MALELDEILIEIEKDVREYKSGAWNGKDRLRELLRQISTNNYLVTKEGIDAYNKWNNIVYTRDRDESVSAAKVRADEKVPELRITRKILEACKQVMLSIQQELSIIKSEER